MNRIIYSLAIASALITISMANSKASHTSEAPQPTNFITPPTVMADKCTWNKVQELDPVFWTPVDTYPVSLPPKHNPRPGAIDQDILDMVKNMTVEEKVGQMTQIEVGQIIDCNGYLNKTAVEYWINKWKVGSFLETPGNHGGRYSWYSPQKFSEITDAVQKIATEQGSKIPIIWGLDSVRGANYVKGAPIFPAGYATAATFNPDRAYDAGRIAAKDTRAAGVHWAFAPILDLEVNKLWSRTYENFGEDPYLSSQMAHASITGYQGDYKHDRSRLAACMKHFIGYGYPFDGTDRGNRHIAPHELLEFYVPPFKAAIDAGVATAMESYSAVNGETVMLSHYYLQTLLRKQLGFKGMLVTDWGEINSQATLYYTAKDLEQANQLALERTSVDMSMVADDQSFTNITIHAVKSGVVSEDRVNESVARILQLKKDLGLFKHPFADKSLQDTVGSKQDVEAARNAARESITLLQNNNTVLPLLKTEKILFLGPTLNSTRFMGGGWNVHWQGPSKEEGDAVYQGFGDTILEGIKEVTGKTPQYMLGVDIYGTELYDIECVVQAAQQADKVVIGLGEHTYAENFGNIGELLLPQKQLDLVNIVAEKAQKPIVVVYVGGRPRRLGNIPNVASGIINAYLPGSYGGLPVSEILYGIVNPSGRLPVSYPAFESQASTTIWQPSYMVYDPQWAFGYGLGYSKIQYSNITLSKDTLKVGEPITVSLTVTNMGPYPQKEPILLFTHQQYRVGYAPELWRLRAFQKVDLAVNECKEVSLKLKAEDLAFWDRDLKKRIEPAPITVAINPYTQVNLTAVVQLEGDPAHVIAQGLR